MAGGREIFSSRDGRMDQCVLMLGLKKREKEVVWVLFACLKRKNPGLRGEKPFKNNLFHSGNIKWMF